VQRREISEKTAELVDAEVKRLVDEAYQRAVATLEAERDLLESIADALLERETLDREDIDLLAAGKPLPPLEPTPADGQAVGGPAAPGRMAPALGAAADREEGAEGRSGAASAAREAAARRIGGPEADPDAAG